MFRAILAVTVLFLAACENGPGITYGPAQLRVTDGADQTHPAAVADSLDDPVAAQLFRTAQGGITFRIVPELHAQTNVQGVPGHQVCAVAVGNGDGLKPWNPCNATDSLGMALFFFDPSTKAGVHCAEIRAIVDNQQVVADSVCATVEPGPVAQVNILGAIHNRDAGESALFEPNTFEDAYGNAIPFTITATGGFVVANEVGGLGRRGIAPAVGAEVGATARVDFHRGEEVIHAITATLVGSNVPGKWGVEFSAAE